MCVDAALGRIFALLMQKMTHIVKQSCCHEGIVRTVAFYEPCCL